MTDTAVLPALSPTTSIQARARRLRQKFGIGIDEYAALQRQQDGRCFICNRPPAGKSLAVDHDHKTGVLRGLLCYRCNYGLQFYSDDTRRLQRAIEYLASPPAVAALGVRLAPAKKRKSRKRH